MTESYLRRWVIVARSPRSLTATISTSAPFPWIARKKFLPMRPNPLTPTRMVMTSLLAVSALAQLAAPVRPRCPRQAVLAGAALGRPVGTCAVTPTGGERVASADVTMGLGPIWQLGYVVRDLDIALEHWLAAGVGPWYV